MPAAVPDKDTEKEDKPASFFIRRPSAAEFYGIRRDQAELEAKLDKKDIRFDPAMKTNASGKFITVPEDYPDIVDFTTAKEVPEIDFAVVQNIEPWELPKDDEIDVSPLSQSGGFAMWCGFGAIRRGSDGCFYYSIGNHMYYRGNAYMMKYDPATGKQSVSYELRDVIDWDEDAWTDGKIHGNPDMDAAGDMVVTSFSGPRPLANDLDGVNYQGGHLIKHNIHSGRTTDLGVPLSGDTWAYSGYGGNMGILFAVGQAKGMVMAYDVRREALLYGGFPPPEIKWWMRCILIDDDTGRIYSSNVKDRGQTEEMPFVTWEPRYNRFRTLDIQTPVNPVSGKREPLRAHTPGKDRDGNYWCFDEFGHMFTFDPVKEIVKPIGLNWGEKGKYTANMVMSPGGRYVYYLPGAHNRMHEYGTPIVQYDTASGTKKVIAFLNDFYIEEYGYNPFGAYGIEIDRHGESLFFYTNGLFAPKKEGSGYGRPAIFHVRIPDSERIE